MVPQLSALSLALCLSAVLMTSDISMIMEQAVMPMDTTKYNHKPLILSLNISASILLDKI